MLESEHETRRNQAKLGFYSLLLNHLLRGDKVDPHPMKYEDIYERSQSADRMEVVMIVTSAIGGIAAIVALLTYGWLVGFGLLLLSAIAFALSRVFNLVGDLLTSVGRLEEGKKPGPSGKSEIDK